MAGLTEMATRERDQEIRKDMKRRLRRAGGTNSRLLCWFLVSVSFFFAVIMVLEKVVPPKLMELGLLSEAFVGRMESLSQIITTPLLYGVAFLVLLPLILLRGNREEEEELRTWMGRPAEGYLVDKWFMLRWVLIGIGVTQFLNYLASGLFFLIGMVTGFDLVGAAAMIQPDALNRIVTFAAAVIAAPLLEELLFRGTILRRTLRYGQWFAIVCTAGACALMNPKPAQAVNAFFLGVVCGYVTVKTKSVWPAVVIHATQAFLTTMALLLESFLLNENGHIIHYIYRSEGSLLLNLGINGLRLVNFAAIGAGLFLLVKEVTFRRWNFLLENGMPGLSPLQKTVAYFTAPASILLVLLAVGMFVLNGLGLDLGSSRWMTLL